MNRACGVANTVEPASHIFMPSSRLLKTVLVIVSFQIYSMPQRAAVQHNTIRIRKVKNPRMQHHNESGWNILNERNITESKAMDSESCLLGLVITIFLSLLRIPVIWAFCLICQTLYSTTCEEVPSQCRSGPWEPCFGPLPLVDEVVNLNIPELTSARPWVILYRDIESKLFRNWRPSY